MKENRLEAFENMLKAILSQYDSTTEKLAKLKAEGKKKTQLIDSFLQVNYNFRRCCRIFGLMGWWIRKITNARLSVLR